MNDELNTSPVEVLVELSELLGGKNNNSYRNRKSKVEIAVVFKL